MAVSHQSGPLNIGPDSPAGEPSAIGAVVLVQEYDLDVTDVTPGTGVDAFRLPDGSSYLGAEVLVKTVSDAGTSATLKIVNSDGDIITGFDVDASTGLLSLAAGDASIASSSRFISPADGADTTQQVVYEESGTAATQGAFLVRVFYLQGA